MAIGSESEARTPPYTVPFQVRRFTVAEYQRMAQSGILTEDDSVELLEGWITPKMTKNPPHDASIDLTNEAISPLLPAVWRIRIQTAIETDDSQPEPDISVVRGPARRWAEQHPGKADVAMVVEVAESSLQRDRNKCRLYARAGIPFYWIVNLVNGTVEVYSDPSGDTEEPGYAKLTTAGQGENVEVIIGGQEVGTIAVSNMLP